MLFLTKSIKIELKKWQRNQLIQKKQNNQQLF